MIFGELKPVQFRIGAVECHQFVMGARFLDMSLFQENDPVCFSYGGKPVGNDNRCSPFDHRVDGMLDQSLGIRINGGCRFVENQDRRVV